jgi:hypothetical protein
MIGDKSSNLNLDTTLGFERLREIEQEQANLTEAQKEEKRKKEKEKRLGLSMDGFESWQNKNRTKPYEQAMGQIGKSWSEKTNIDFSQAPGYEQGPSSSATPPSAGGGANFGAGALSALQQAPAIISNLSEKPTSNGEKNAMILNSTAQFAQIGGSIVPGWGHAIGAVVGAGAGFIGQSGWYNDKVEKENALMVADLQKSKQQRMEEYMQGKTSDQLKAEAKAYAKALGYSDRGLTS